MAGDHSPGRLSTWMQDCATELDLSWEEVAERAGMTAVNLRRIRKGGQDIPPRTKRNIERALQVEPGSIDAVLSGAALPQPRLTTPPSVKSSPLAEVLDASEDELDKMQRLFERYRPGEGKTFRAWADGVRTAHAEGPSILPHGPTASEAG